jgi:hypothetical protein
VYIHDATEQAYKNGYAKGYEDGKNSTDKLVIDKTALIDLLGDAICAQLKWERDTAIAQLESYGVGFCEDTDVRRVQHGQWIAYISDRGDTPHIDYKCSCCNYDDCCEPDMNYCPNCGAKMDKEN